MILKSSFKRLVCTLSVFALALAQQLNAQNTPPTAAAPATATASAPAGDSKEVTLFDFEPGGKNSYYDSRNFELVAQHATEGKHAARGELKEKASKFSLQFDFKGGINLGGKWGQFDRFVLDVFVDGGGVNVYTFIRGEEGTDWEHRFNNNVQLRPGANRIEIPTGSIVQQRGQKPMDLAKLNYASVNFTLADPAKAATVFIDNARLLKGTASFQVKKLFSFEEGNQEKIVLEDWPEEFKGKSKLTFVTDRATDGKLAAKIQSVSPSGNIQFTPSQKDQDWTGFDTLMIDVFLAGDNPTQVSGWIRNNPTDDWSHRYNWERMLKPGLNTIKLSIGSMAFPGGRGYVDPSKIALFNLTAGEATIFVDNVRLVKGIEEVPVAGIRKFDFGPPKGAVMPGFTAVSKETAYDKAAGFGWLPKGDFGRDFDVREVLARHRPADDLWRDFCNPSKASFVVDLPNGQYKVHMMLAPPGARVWQKTLEHRTVSAQGKVVFDQKWDAESFKKWEFQWEDVEDLPGDDLWEKYINTACKPVSFDAQVTDGQIKFDFDGHGKPFEVMLCGLVLYPQEQDKQAQKWLAGLDNLRKEQFESLHVEAAAADEPAFKGVTAEHTAAGFVRFIHSPDRNITYKSQPTEQEVAAAGIELSAAPGEYEDGCFGILPLKDGVKVIAAVGELSGLNGAKIAAADIDIQVGRYKALNRDAVYRIEPKYLDKLGKDGLTLKKGITRSFWVIIKTPADAPAGKYSGTITVTADGKDHKVPLSLTVWPIKKLSEPSIPMAMFMTTPVYSHVGLAKDEELKWKAWEEVLRDAREHGMTTSDPIISMPLKRIVDGKAEIDFSQMDRFMELSRKCGYTQTVSGYAISPGFAIRPEVLDDEAKLAARYGVKTYGEIIKAYFAALGEHAKAKNYLPIAFGSDDEYLIHPGKGPERVREFHQILKDNAPGFQFVAYDSIYPDQKPDLIPAYEKMLPAVDTWGAGIHTPKMAELVKKSGSKMWLYNTGMNRFTFGTYMFFANKKYDVSGFVQWIYPNGGTLTSFDHMSFRESHYGVTYPSSRGLRTTAIWERIRAGCDDHRYLQTAWDLIAAAKKSGKNVEIAKELEQNIEKTFARLPFGKPNADAIAGDGKADNPLDPAGMEKFRAMLAEGIIKLQE